MPDQTPSMPPLPEPVYRDRFYGEVACDCYHDDQMRAYAQAVADERVREAEADARRYRQLRDDLELPYIQVWHTRDERGLTGMELDQALDAARPTLSLDPSKGTS